MPVHIQNDQRVSETGLMQIVQALYLFKLAAQDFD